MSEGRPALDSVEFCKKCGQVAGREARASYISWGDFIQRECRRCGYTWEETVL
jgi:hypothetical protein